LKRAIVCLLLLFGLTGFLFLGTGCGTLFQRDNGAAPVEFSQPEGGAQPAAEAPLAAEAAKPQAVAASADPAPVAVSNAPAGRRWYRFWGKSAPKEASAEAPVAVEAAKPGPAMAGTDGVAATNGPAARPWYKFWGRKASAAGAAPVDEKPVELPSGKGLFSTSGEPLIKPGYNLRMSVSAGGKMEMAEQVKTVSDKGDITLPLIGTVPCEGKTVVELATQLEKLYEQYIRDPQASVEFVYTGQAGEISPWGAVAVYGRVRQPGRVNIPPTRDLTLSRAIQFSGGALDDAKQSAIEVTRRNKDGSKTRFEIDLDAVAKRGESEKDIVLEHGDMVNVPQSTW
jgi:protein involved in polysaccharide export with SLBB domain